ncbi:MAG: twitching motility protein PilJ [Porticoccus sp.]|jgi:twitching motility protein PilJ
MNRKLHQSRKSPALLVTTLALMAALGFVGYTAWLVISLPLIQEELRQLYFVILLLDEYHKFSYPVFFSGALCVVLLMLISVEIYRRSRERFAIESNNQQAVFLLLDQISSLNGVGFHGDTEEIQDFNGTIPEAIKFSIEKLQALADQIQGSSENLSATVNETRVIASQLAEVSEHQSDEISTVTKAIKELEGTIDGLSAQLKGAVAETEEISSLAKKGATIIKNTAFDIGSTQDQINETSKHVNRLSENFKEIGSLILALNDMADQAHIFGLNAAIQASTAGDAGKGFGVIAEEIQRLAERSGVATKQITALIRIVHVGTNETISSMDKAVLKATKGKKVSDEASHVVTDIEGVVLGLAKQINDAAITLTAQRTLTIKVSKTMDVIQDISSQLLFGTNNTAEIMNELADVSLDLSNAVSGFRQPAMCEDLIDEPSRSTSTPDFSFGARENQIDLGK